MRSQAGRVELLMESNRHTPCADHVWSLVLGHWSFELGAYRIRPDTERESGVSWLISWPRKKLITMLRVESNLALAA